MATRSITREPRPVQIELDQFPGASVWRLGPGEFQGAYLGVSQGPVCRTQGEAEALAIRAWVAGHPETWAATPEGQAEARAQELDEQAERDALAPEPDLTQPWVAAFDVEGWRDLAQQLAWQGYVRVLYESVDTPIAEAGRCPHCEQALTYAGWQRPGRYLAYAVCQPCDQALEF